MRRRTTPSLSRTAVEKIPSVRFRAWQLVTRTVFARALHGLGRGSVIVSPQILRGTDRISLGERCLLNGQCWLQCETPGGPLTIGDNVYLGHRVHLHAGSPITIGSGCVLADGVFIASVDHSRHGDRHQVMHTDPVTVGNDVFIGQHAVVLGGVTIGTGATIGAGAVVTHDVPPHTTVVGVPARPLTDRRRSKED
ncbi:acyltransferase [Actinomyces urogenitalis]|uniref:acyltransferase n=1 Tax=Actinomyces urogenitalis TaxID=103621 RepID=UPI003C6CC0C1